MDHLTVLAAVLFALVTAGVRDPRAFHVCGAGMTRLVILLGAVAAALTGQSRTSGGAL